MLKLTIKTTLHLPSFFLNFLDCVLDSRHIDFKIVLSPMHHNSFHFNMKEASIMRVHLHPSLRTRASLMLVGLGYCNCVKVSNSRLCNKFYSFFLTSYKKLPTSSFSSHLFTPLVILSSYSFHPIFLLTLVHTPDHFPYLLFPSRLPAHTCSHPWSPSPFTYLLITGL